MSPLKGKGGDGQVLVIPLGVVGAMLGRVRVVLLIVAALQLGFDLLASCVRQRRPSVLNHFLDF